MVMERFMRCKSTFSIEEEASFKLKESIKSRPCVLVPFIFFKCSRSSVIVMAFSLNSFNGSCLFSKKEFSLVIGSIFMYGYKPKPSTLQLPTSSKQNQIFYEQSVKDTKNVSTFEYMIDNRYLLMFNNMIKQTLPYMCSN